MDNTLARNNDVQLAELYFLISKFLKNGPLQNASQVVIDAMETQKFLPKRIDWTGQEHDQTFAELETKYSHIGPNHLFDICLRIAPILDKELKPSVPGVLSLLGAGRQSLLRTKETINKPKTLRHYFTRLHSMPLTDAPNRKNIHNIVNVLYGREMSGPIIRQHTIPPSFYSKQSLLRRTLGHLSAVYCVLFDQSGKYIMTGADDLLVKLWSAIDGRLLTTFRGASSEITDIAINLDNTLLAAGSLDRILRVWDLQTGSPIAVLSSHTGMITSVKFCPSPRGDLKYLVTTSTDGSVAFWQYSTPRGGKTVFAVKPIQYHEKIRPGQAQMICASFSQGGIFLASGSADHHVRIYIMAEEGPKRILEIEAHTDTVDSIQWSHNGLKFISGSKDGIALVWHFESQQWKSMKLNMLDRLPSCPTVQDDDIKKLKVTMVSWDYTDKWIITAVNDFTIKVWNAATGKLHKVMRGHTEELYVLESHPKDPNVLISAGHDGQLFIWDIIEGVAVASFINHIDGQGHSGIFDAKWSPDGSMIAATDSHGHILMFGFGTGHERLKLLPRELFFHTDYRPLVRDPNHYVMDEQTQTMPHLMPPPFLVDVDGNPYPPTFQRLVPGREHCPTEQLIPNIAVGPEGVEVIEGANSLSEIDRLIAALANRHGQPDSNNDRENSVPNARAAYNFPRASAGRVGLRRNGDLEGVRLSSGNWQQVQNFKWLRRVFVRPLEYYRLITLKQAVYVAGQQEVELYKREMRRRPLMICTGNVNLATSRPPLRRGRYAGNRRVDGSLIAYRTRARREEDYQNHDENNPDNIASSSSDPDDSSDLTEVEEDYMNKSSSSETDSSDYSDWVATDQPTLEPPKRLKRKPVSQRLYTPNDSNQSQNNNNSNNNNNNNVNNKTLGRKKIPVPENGEIPEPYRPPEWLSEVIPRKAPYYPQMGDEVVYFRQGHQRYLDAVRNKDVYKLNSNCEPWVQLDLRDHELVKVIGIKYEIRPPRLCCLKLALINCDGILVGQSFTIKYHDIPDVLDFIVLRQTYDTAVRRLWTPGDRFRCMIDDGWWMGLIESRVALSPEFPNSLFMCFRIRWDNGEYEFMSPWDMEPIDSSRLPTDVGGAVSVLPEELRSTLYQPKSEEWPRGDRDASCRRIVAGLETVMSLAIAEPFLAPVDLNAYPTYAYVVEYPIDLATIKARFDNHFYRRITSAQFDVRYLATNAEKFNKSRSNIIKHARIITDLCLRIVKEHNEVDVRAVYHQLVDTYITSDSDDEQHDGPSTSSGINKRPARRTKRLKSDFNWRVKCRELLEMMSSCADSTPFRNPVDIIEHPDYTQIVDTPMDLRTVREDLQGGNYETPLDFAKDMRLIFTNSRNYNTNKRSKIYSMTIRLSALFETHMKQLIQDWRSTKRHTPKKENTTELDRNRPGTSKMATRATTNANGSLNHANRNIFGNDGHRRNNNRNRQNTNNNQNNINSNMDDDDDDDDDDDNVNGGGGGVGNVVTNGNDDDDDDDDDENIDLANLQRRNRGRQPKQNQSNGVSSSSIYLEPTPGPSTSNISRLSSNLSLNHTNDNDETYLSTSSGSSSFDSDSDDDSDESHGISIMSLGMGVKQRKRPVRNSDSEDSYKPNRRQISKPNKRGRKKKKNKTNRHNKVSPHGRTPQSGRPPLGRPPLAGRTPLVRQPPGRPRRIHSDDDRDLDYGHNERTPKKQPGRPKRRHKQQRETDGSNSSVHEKKLKRRNRKYNSDHSYHINPTINNCIQPQENDSDTEHDVRRPKRGNDTQQQSPSTNGSQDHLRRNSRRKLKPSESENSQEPTPSTSRIMPYRPMRSTRYRASQDDSDDDRTLSELTSVDRVRRNFRTRGGMIDGSTTDTSQQLSRRPLATTAISTRTQATILESSTRIHRSHVQDDHNYDEPGPSSMRLARLRPVTLSRHQRNPDELDIPHVESDALHNLTQTQNISNRLRHRNHVNSRAILANNNNNNNSNSNSNSNSSCNNNQSFTNVRSMYVEHDEDDDDDDDDEEQHVNNNNLNNDKNGNSDNNSNDDDDDGDGGDNVDHVENDVDDDDDSDGDDDDDDDDENEENGNQVGDANDDDLTDPEDNKPLRYVAITSRKTTIENHKTRSSSGRRLTRKKTLYRDDDYDNGNNINPTTSTSRSTRIQKRPYYNEDSDDSITAGSNKKRITLNYSVSAGGSNNNATNTWTATTATTSSSQQQQHTNHFNVRNNIDDENSDSEQPLSVSSRGRIRKLTAKARDFLRD